MPIETLRPNAVGDSSTLVPVGAAANWDCCDEAISDVDLTYVRSSNLDDLPYLDLYNIVNTAIPAGSTINSVTVRANIRSTNALWQAIFRLTLKTLVGATQYGPMVQPPIAYTVYSNVFAGVGLADLNDLQIGIGIESTFTGVLYRHGRCTQVWVEIDYTLVTQIPQRMKIGVGL